MTIDSDTDDLVDTTIWGEVVTIMRNTVAYDSAGMSSDTWASVATPNGDIQPISGVNPTVITGDMGQDRILTHRIFVPTGTTVRQGDRIRPSGWSAGDDEYVVDSVLDEEGHIEIRARSISGHG